MDDQSQSKLASGLMVLAGIWLAISPTWISMSGGALATVIIAGIVTAVVGIIQYFWENTLPSWIGALTAVILFISAWAYDVGDSAVTNMALSAVAILLLSFWDGVEISHVRERHHSSMQ